MGDQHRVFTIHLRDRPFKVFVQTERYLHGDGLAVELILAKTNEPFATLSVNVENIRIDRDEFIFKTYSENAGLLESLLSLGIVELTGRKTDFGPVCRLAKTTLK